MIQKLSFQDSSGKIELDNFCIAAENGNSILNYPILEPKRLGKLIEGHSKERIQKLQQFQVRKYGQYQEIYEIIKFLNSKNH